MSIALKSYRIIQVSIVVLMLLFSAADVLAYPQAGALFWGYLSVIITVTGYLLYIASMYRDEPNPRRRVKPHPFYWLLGGFLTGTTWMIQEMEGGKAGSWCLGLTAAFCFGIAWLSYWRYRHEWKFDAFDRLLLLSGLTLFLFYLLSEAAVVSATLALCAGMPGFGTLIRKGWKHPHTDNPVNFIFNSVKCAPALLALPAITYTTSAYLWTLLVMNGFVAAMLIIRRRYVRPELAAA